MSSQKGYAKFVEERQEDEREREREYALQSLDLAYHKYCEIIRDLGQGLEVRILTSYLTFAIQLIVIGIFLSFTIIWLRFSHASKRAVGIGCGPGETRCGASQVHVLIHTTYAHL